MSFSVLKSGRAFLVNLNISLVATVLVLLLTQDILIDFPPLDRAELSLIDLRFQKRGRIKSARDSSNIVIVEISQESFKSLPESWPWPKSYYARLVRNLKRAGAKVVGLDVIFTSADSRNPRDNEDFKNALHEMGNVVLAGKLETEHRRYLLREHGEHYGNVFVDSTENVGLVNARVDADGELRRYMPFAFDS